MPFFSRLQWISSAPTASTPCSVRHESPFHEPRDRSINRFPTGAEDSGRFPPGQPPGPAGQKSDYRRGAPLLACSPGHAFDHHPVLYALHPPRWIVIVNVEPRVAQTTIFAEPAGHGRGKSPGRAKICCSATDVQPVAPRCMAPGPNRSGARCGGRTQRSVTRSSPIASLSTAWLEVVFSHPL